MRRSRPSPRRTGRGRRRPRAGCSATASRIWRKATRWRAGSPRRAGRRGAEDEIEAAISEWSVAHDAGELADRLQRRGVPASSLQDMDDIVNRDAGMRDFFFRYEHEGVEFRVQHQPFTWGGQRLPSRRSPFLGEHNAQVLIHEFGLSDERFAALVRERLIA